MNEPSSAPARPRTKASMTTETTTGVPPNPIARRIAISVLRALTAEYIVLSGEEQGFRVLIRDLGKADRLRGRKVEHRLWLGAGDIGWQYTLADERLAELIRAAELARNQVGVCRPLLSGD